jgi:hypothetical protein
MKPPSSLALATPVAPKGSLRDPGGRPPTDRQSRIRGRELDFIDRESREARWST